MSLHTPTYTLFSFRQVSFKGLLNKLRQQTGSPHQVAMAFALGTFISVLPTPGLNFVLASLALARWRQLHRGSMLASLGVWNMAVTAPLYALSLQIGKWLFGHSIANVGSLSIWEQPHLWIQGFLVGNLLLALSTAVLSYLIIKTAASRGRKRPF